ncbi:type II secretion system protein [Fibrobacter sp.]|jgi:type II secretory pathway pseudopilin PulG|uniref:type IV pilus modification PilV family protein n=1 Tax=Fibrobacter sp. TaxID=35828 RepID=UPI00386CCF71
MTNSKKSKSGFGIVEVLVAAAVLGFMYMAVMNMHGGNHDSLLRIRGRDGATEVAQNLIDSLGALGLASLSDDHLEKDEDGNIKPIVIDPIVRTWQGQPGAVTNTITVNYRAEITVSNDNEYKTKSSSMLLGTDSVEHVYAKRLDVKVSWQFKNTTQSITVSGVVR